jgi:hypothetical protein
MAGAKAVRIESSAAAITAQTAAILSPNVLV